MKYLNLLIKVIKCNFGYIQSQFTMNIIRISAPQINNIPFVVNYFLPLAERFSNWGTRHTPGHGDAMGLPGVRGRLQSIGVLSGKLVYAI